MDDRTSAFKRRFGRQGSEFATTLKRAFIQIYRQRPEHEGVSSGTRPAGPCSPLQHPAVIAVIGQAITSAFQVLMAMSNKACF